MRKVIELAKRVLAGGKVTQEEPAVPAMVIEQIEYPHEPEPVELPPHVVAHLEMAHWLVNDLLANPDKWDDGWNNWLRREGGIVLSIDNVNGIRGPRKLRASFRLPSSERDWTPLCDEAQRVLIPAIEDHYQIREQRRQAEKSIHDAGIARAVLADWVACTKATPTV